MAAMKSETESMAAIMRDFYKLSSLSKFIENPFIILHHLALKVVR